MVIRNYKIQSKYTEKMLITKIVNISKVNLMDFLTKNCRYSATNTQIFTSVAPKWSPWCQLSVGMYNSKFSKNRIRPLFIFAVTYIIYYIYIHYNNLYIIIILVNGRNAMAKRSWVFIIYNYYIYICDHLYENPSCSAKKIFELWI